MHRLVIGRVTAPHGVRGQIRFQPLTDFPERFETQKQLRLISPKGEERLFDLTSVQILSRGLFVFTLAGVTDRNAAEALRGWKAVIAPEERMPLGEGQYWIDDLIGLTVTDSNGVVLGRVKDVTNAGASDLFVVVDEEGKEHYIPFVDQFVRRVDLPNRRLTVELIEGLWQ